MAFTPDNDLIGQQVGSYEMESVLGRGGMGTVYSGTHLKIGRKAAIKVLNDALAMNEEFVSRFVNEAKVVNNIRHKNIIDIVEFVEEDDPRRVAYIMELLEGPTLTELLRSRKLNVIEAVHITTQIVSAMKAVHAVGVIHRDLKPDNILIDGHEDIDFTQAGSIRILDFGIAKLTGAENVGHRTATGAIIGTPVYMAPEQASIHEITTSCDVFAVGEIAYELFTGQRLFTGDNMEILRAKIRGEMPEVIIPAWGVSPEDVALAKNLQDIITGCLEYRPETRIEMSDLHERLKLVRKALMPTARTASMATITPASISMKDLEPPSSPSLESAAFQTNSVTASGLIDKVSSGRSFLNVGIAALVLSIAIVFGAQWMRSPGTLSTQIPTTGSAVGKVVPLETAREIQISSKPAGALLIEFESRQELGITPMKVEVLTGKTRKLEVQAKGHQTKIIELDDSSKATHLVLVPNKPVAPKVAPRPKPAAVKRSAPVKKVIKSPPKPAPRRKPIRAAPSPAKKPPPKVYKPPKKKKPAPAMKKGEVPKWSDW